MTSDDSDVTTDWTPTENTQTDGSIFSTTTSDTAKSYDPGIQYCGAQTSSSTKVNCSTTNNYNSGHNAQGNYYNFTAATAGTRSQSSSICPKGWMLPPASVRLGGNYFSVLLGDVIPIQILYPPFYFTVSGYISTYSNIAQPSKYWTSTTKTVTPSGTLMKETQAVIMSFSVTTNTSTDNVSMTNLSFDGTTSLGDGLPIRCVTRRQLLSGGDDIIEL